MGVTALATSSRRPKREEASAPPAPSVVAPSLPRRSQPSDAPRLACATPPRIAVYTDPLHPPAVIPTPAMPRSDEEVPAFIEALADYAHSLAAEQGGSLPLVVFRELIDNLVHASFAEVVITILDQGNTLRISDRGPGIADKGAAQRPGFTSADSWAKQFIRGVGSGFTLVREALAPLGGSLEIEDNLGQGTVVTVHVRRPDNIALAPPALPTYNLSERQLKALLLTMELAPVGPTRLAQELAISTSTAYRDLLLLEELGLVRSEEAGHRFVTDAGLAYVNTLL